MNDELAARHRAITLRLASRPVKAICAAVGRSEVWFHRWWRRLSGGRPRRAFYDLTRSQGHHVAQRILPEAGAAPSSRSAAGSRPMPRPATRSAARSGPQPSYGRTERPLNIHPLLVRMHDRASVLQAHVGFSLPRVRLLPPLPSQEYRGPLARASNDLHEVDLVGPIYLKGSRHRYYIGVGKDVFDAPARLPPSPGRGSRPYGRGPRVSRGVLEGPGPAGPGPTRQRPRVVRLQGARRHAASRGVIRLCLQLRRRAGVRIPKGSRSSTAASRTSTAGSSRGCSSGGSGGRATCAASWCGCRRR